MQLVWIFKLYISCLCTPMKDMPGGYIQVATSSALLLIVNVILVRRLAILLIKFVVLRGMHSAHPAPYAAMALQAQPDESKEPLP